MVEDAYELYHGDSLEVLQALPSDSVHSIVTDPPAGIKFMGNRWDEPGSFFERAADKSVRFDKFAGNHNPSDAFDKLRTLKNEGAKFRAGLQVIFTEALRVLKPGGHAMVWALPRTSHWTASALEDAGFEIRDVVVHVCGTGFPKSMNVGIAIDKMLGAERPVVDEAKLWEGWGTALKPSAEHWILCRRPPCGPIARNTLRHGVGGLNI
ncbi:MAG: hypothetical protein L0214_15950, partial [candidate division NC10 bacterium]|nr:hypothetical protein [candidate division NC10 bacterium]